MPLRPLGKITVPAGGTPVSILASMQAAGLLFKSYHAAHFQALPANVGKVYIGTSTMDRTTLANCIHVLAAPASGSIPSFGMALIGSAAGIVEVDSSYQSDRSRTAATSTATLTYTANDVPETVRTRIPREARRCGRLEHSITIPGAIPAWQMHGASYVWEPLATRFRDAS